MHTHLVVNVLFSGHYLLQCLTNLLVQFVQVDLRLRQSRLYTLLVCMHLLIMYPPVLCVEGGETEGGGGEG